MEDAKPQMLTVGAGDDAREIAIHHRPGNAPGVIWLGGFMSDMAGSKALAVEAWALENGRAATRFDYSGHGVSGGTFADGTISRWLEESLAVFESSCKEPTILIGSSMGGWIALLLTRALRAAGKGDLVAGLVLIAPAVDFTEDLMWQTMSDEVKREILENGVYLEPSDYSEEPYTITRDLIEDGRDNLMFGGEIETGCPVHILQGVQGHRRSLGACDQDHVAPGRGRRDPDAGQGRRSQAVARRGHHAASGGNRENRLSNVR